MDEQLFDSPIVTKTNDFDGKTPINKSLTNLFIIITYIVYMVIASFVTLGISTNQEETTKDWITIDVEYDVLQEEDIYKVHIYGTVMNQTDKVIDLSQIYFDLFDDKDNLIQSYLYLAEDLKANQTTEIDVTFDATTFPDSIKFSSQIPIRQTLSNVLNVVVSSIAIFAFWTVNKKNYIENFKQSRKLGRSFFGLVLVGFILVYASNIVAQSIMSLFESPSTSLNEAAIASMFTNNPLNLIALFLTLVVLTPIIEETVFRKGIYGLVEQRFGDVTAIIFSGLIFGFLHVAGWGDYINVFPYLAMGLSFSFIYYYSGKNIYVVIALHMLNNFIPYLTYFIDSIS